MVIILYFGANSAPIYRQFTTMLHSSNLFGWYCSGGLVQNGLSNGNLMWQALIRFFSKLSFAAISQRPVQLQETQRIDLDVDEAFTGLVL